MRKSRFAEAQILRILQEAEAGPVAEVLRRHGVSAKTFYRWKAKFAGMTVSEAKRLGQLEDENSRLQRLVADQALDLSVLQDLINKFS